MSLKEFDIELSKLRQGKNQYDYRLAPSFFENFGNQSIRQTDLGLMLELDKGEFVVNLRFVLEGSLGLDCEKCLAAYNQQVESVSSLIVKITDEEQPADEEDEILYLSKKANSFNIGQQVYDMVMLSLPFVKNCADPGKLPECDKSMLEKLDKLSQIDREDEPDERWSKLKDFLSNN